jgi:eukaryotic-like serine/threonine-protein kinase
MSSIRHETVDDPSMDPPSPAPTEGGFGLKPGATIANYRLIEKLGEGGMGAVFLAEDVNLRRKVALKVMKPTIATERASRERFLREARAAARIQHDNIVPIFYVGEDKGILFLAMQLLRGESLRARLKHDSRPSLPFILKVGRDVAQGLAAAHAEGFVHRDIKPDNIWIEANSVDDPTSLERAKVLDFGLVRPQENDEHLTRAGAMLGTPAYMSPEQACGESVDHRADLFSLGCVLYQMSTGRLPFSGTSAFSILSNLALTAPPEPRTLNAELPPAFAKLIMWMLEKEPSKRPSSARDVVEAIRQLQPDSSTRSPAISIPDAALKSFSTPTSPPPKSGARQPLPPIPRAPELEEVHFQPRASKAPLWIAAVVVGLLAVIAAGFLLKSAVRTTQSGTLEVEVQEEASARFQKGNLRVYDLNGNTLHTLLPSERSRKLEVGTYRVKVIDVKGLRVEPEQFTIENGSKVTVKVWVDLMKQ